jgi:ABC-type multidrug transport system fused ATPase/permease subunit
MFFFLLHKLGLTKITDCVVVMREAKIIVVAPHNELVQSCEYYAEMYNLQTVWYAKQSAEKEY